MKIIYSIIFACTLSFTPALMTSASARIELSEPEAQPITISQSGSTLTVYGAVGKTLQVYNLIGVPVMTIRIDSPEKRIDLSNLPHGIYPIKVGNITKKIRI